MKGEMHFIKSGLLTTIQDKGRYGMREFGVPLSGAMDQYSADLCNMILGNGHNTPLFEITLQGPVISFDAATSACITGANLSPKLNGEAIELNKRTKIEAGDLLTFGEPLYGVRCYLGLIGGFDCEKVLGSASQYQFVTPENRIKKGEKISYKSFSHLEEGQSKVAINQQHFSENQLEVTLGPDAHLFDEKLGILLNQKWKVTSNDRMGYVLSCDAEDFSHSTQILTAPVTPGTVQLTPSGKLIVLMRDAQVTGGYPRVLQVGERSLDVLAQKISGDEVGLTL